MYKATDTDSEGRREMFILFNAIQFWTGCDVLRIPIACEVYNTLEGFNAKL